MNIEISIEELLKRNKPKLNGTAREFSSSDFWYYTNLDTAVKILCSNSFWASNLTLMNDKSESTFHKDEADIVHALCFCNSNSEKIPLWYLYAGLAGQGISIGITPAAMRDFINSIKTVRVVGNNRTLQKIRDYELQCGWVFYKKYLNVFNYKRRFYSIPKSDADAFLDRNYFIKDYPWEYEKEFRLIFINKTGIPADRLIIEFPEAIYKKFKIRLGPEIIKENIKEELSQCDDDSKGVLLEKLKILKSELKVKMNLLNRNRKSVVLATPRIIQDYKNSILGDEVALEELKSILRDVKKIILDMGLE